MVQSRNRLASESAPRPSSGPGWIGWLAVVVIVGFFVAIGLHHRATMRLLAEKTAEAERKTQELSDLQDELQAAVEGDGQADQTNQTASDLADVLEDNQKQQRRLAIVLDSLGPVLEAGAEVSTLQVAAQRVALAGCAASPEVVDLLIETFSQLPDLERQETGTSSSSAGPTPLAAPSPVIPAVSGQSPGIADPAASTSSSGISFQSPSSEASTAALQPIPAADCTESPWKLPFLLEWAIREQKPAGASVSP